MADDQGIYRASPVKRRERRSNAKVQADRQRIVEIIREIQPATVRQVFYQAEVRGVITKDQYHKVQPDLKEMREQEIIPWEWILDKSRSLKNWNWAAAPSMADRLQEAVARYFVSRRSAFDADLEFWIEKESAVDGPVRQYWQSLMVYHGNPSSTIMKHLADRINQRDKSTIVYMVVDWDPSGVVAEGSLRTHVTEYGADPSKFSIVRLAVTPEQIATWSLPERPTKDDADNKHYPTFERACAALGVDAKRSVEFDAINPNQLRDLIRDTIRGHLDQDEWDRLEQVEADEIEKWQSRVEEMMDAAEDDEEDES